VDLIQKGLHNISEKSIRVVLELSRLEPGTRVEFYDDKRVLMADMNFYGLLGCAVIGTYQAEDADLIVAININNIGHLRALN
jgi:hypothetical protein